MELVVNTYHLLRAKITGTSNFPEGTEVSEQCPDVLPGCGLCLFKIFLSVRTQIHSLFAVDHEGLGLFEKGSVIGVYETCDVLQSLLSAIAMIL